MKTKKNYLLLLLCLASSVIYAQNGNNGRPISVSPNLSIVNNQPKLHAPQRQIEENQSKQNITEDLFVSGKLGIGADMTDNTSVEFTTMIMKENNIRLLFDDTSTPGEFASNDWAIKINDTESGGANYFGVEDVTNLTMPFRIMSGATNNSFVIGHNGKIGIGTTNPAKDVHINSGDTPAIGLEQNTSYGYSAQLWDIAGNEANFFIRDVTNENLLPFRIAPGTPSSTLSLKGSGNVGIGTWSPTTKLDVLGTIRTDSTMLFNPLTEAPSGIEGEVYMDATEHTLKVHNGTEWININNDSQDLVDATLTGTILQIDIENGASVSVDLQALVADLEARVAALELLVSGKESVKYTSARLFQNAPNPYKNTTNISYYIPQEVENAVLKITAVDGSYVKDIVIYERGEGNIILSETETDNGTYFYSLIIDGQKLSTKTLIKID